MATIPVNLEIPDDLAVRMKEFGMLEPDYIAVLLRLELSRRPGGFDGVLDKLPDGYDKRLLGVAAPELLGSGAIVGDLDEPMKIEWEALK